MILSSIIHGFKSSTTRIIRTTHNASRYIWQRNYHDHIIRNEKSLHKIRQYIKTNPATWQYDIENPNKIDNMELNKTIA